MFTSPQDLYKTATKFANIIPTTPAQVKDTSDKIRKIAESEVSSVKEVMSILNKAQRGDASMNEMMSVNKKVQDLGVAFRFAAFMAMPGALFALPFAIEMSKEFDIDFVPASVSKEFDL